MSDEQMQLFVGMMSDIAYELHDMDGISEETSEMLLDLWRNFYMHSPKIN